MAKYYVESGRLRQVVEADKPIPAVARAINMLEDLSGWDLDRVITVNERGFIRDRPHREHYPSDIVLETGTLLGMLAENEATPVEPAPDVL